MKKLISIILCISLVLSMGFTVMAEGLSGYVTVSVENLTFTPSGGEEYPTGVMLEPMRLKIKDGDTIISLVMRALDLGKLSYNKDDETGELTGGYISEIGGLAEMDGGEQSGWMITVNDWFAPVGADAMYPSDGDEIVLRYTTDWGGDIGSDWSSSDTSLKSLEFEGGSLSPEFSSDVYEYELTLERDIEKISAVYEASNKNYQIRTYKNAEISEGIISGESEYEAELSGLAASENNLTDILGYYKNGKNISVNADDVITIGCGLTGWTGMNASDGGKLYTVTVKAPVPSEFEEKINELYLGYEEFKADDPTSKEFAKQMAPSIIELYKEFKELYSTEDISKKHIAKLYEMLGEALSSGFDIDIDTVYPNSKITFSVESQFTLSESAVLRVSAIPKDKDEYIYDEAEDIASTDFDLSRSSNKISIRVGDMSRKLKAGERIELYLDFTFDNQVACSQFIGKAVVKASDSGSGGSSGSGTFRPSATPTPDPSTSELPSETSEPTPASPYVYFSVPEKTVGKEASFTDLGDFSWAAESINALVKEGVLNGISDTEFAPGNNVTREQFVKMLVLAFNIEIPTQVIPNFKDVDSNAWYAPYIYAASYAGIAQGESDEYFGIGKNITREDMATMLHRAIDSPETSYTPYFDDYSEISDYAKTAVALFADEGTINGYMEIDGTYFKPKNLATRAEAAKIIYKAK